MKDLIFQLKVNGKDINKVRGKADTSKAEFIKFIKGIMPEFNEAKDSLEIINVTPPESQVLRHKARDKSSHNANIDAILSRQLANLILTYGEDRLLKLLKDIHGLVKPETKAS